MGNNIISGPANPQGFSGIARWADPRLIVPVAVLGIVWMVARPTHVSPPLHRSSASAIAVSDLVATTPEPVRSTVASSTSSSAPLPRKPAPPAQVIATSDLAAVPVQPVAQSPVQPVPTVPPTIPPWVIARQRKAEADYAALHAPLVVAQADVSPATPAPKAETSYWLRRGMSIPATLYTSIDSTVPGLIVAYVSEDIYDFSHAVMVIPHGAKLIGSFANGATIAQGQARIPASFDQIQLADRVIDLGSQPGIDRTGTSALGATVDRHTRGALANFLLVTAAGVLLNRGNTQTCSGVNCAQTSSVGSSVGGPVIQYGSQILQRNGQEQPTLHVAEGAQIALMVTTDIGVKAWTP